MKKKLMVSALVLGSMLVGCAPTDAELTEQGWVKDPAENGWVENPAENGWVKDPATNGWVKDPATNGWVKDPATNGWVENPAENGWVKDPATNGWVENPAENGWVKDPAENGWIAEDQLTPSPVVLDKIVHWVPGADEANLSWEVDLKGATTLNVVFAGKLLAEYVDYYYDTETGLLEVYGSFLEDAELELGEYNGYVFTEYGSTAIKGTVIATPIEEGSTIPLTENESGVLLVSGYSPNILSMVMSDQVDPWFVLKEKLDDNRYISWKEFMGTIHEGLSKKNFPNYDGTSTQILDGTDSDEEPTTEKETHPGGFGDNELNISDGDEDYDVSGMGDKDAPSR